MIRLSLICTLATLTTFPAVASNPPWGKFSTDGGMVVRGEVEVQMYRTRDGFAFRRSIKPTSNARREDLRIDWADGRNCPAVDAALARLSALPMPAIQVPRPMGIPAIIRDGTTYTLEAEAGWDRFPRPIRLESDFGTPLSAWVIETLKSLADCWRPAKPDNVYGVD